MTKPRLVIEFKTIRDRNKSKFALRLISTEVDLISSFVRNGQSVSSGKPSMGEVVKWIADHAALIIALVHATRADAAETRRALAEIAGRKLHPEQEMKEAALQMIRQLKAAEEKRR